MFPKPIKQLLFTCVALAASSSIFAQNIYRPFENSPYSRYALGDEMNAINPAIKAMGSITAAFSDPYIINTDNPASYAHIKHFTYEAGGEGRLRTVTSGNDKFQTGTANISYLNIAVPMGKYGGMLIGFRPQYKMSYALYDTLQTLLGSSSHSYTGDGNAQYFFIGGAGTYKGFSLGANLGYIFGHYNQSSWLRSSSTTSNVNNSEFQRNSSIGGMYLKLGAQYEKIVYKDYTLRLGAQLNTKQNINTERNEYWISHPFYSTDTSGSDTAYRTGGSKEKITLPTEMSFGLQIAKSDKWMLGVNYKSTNWSQFSFAGLQDSIGSKSYKFSVGGEYTPNSLSIYNYWKRVTYRAGFYLGQDFVSIAGQQANYYAATFGLSLPFRRSTDRIHTAIELGNMSSTSTSKIQTNFVRFTFGVSFNDKSFFVKRKYE